jgi:hypothetical protein
MSVDLTLVWAGLLAFAVFAYIVMDGFDLGVGILFPTLKAGDQRDKAMNSIAPVWRPVRGLPPRLCGPDAGGLHADHRHAAGAGLPGRRL